MKVEFLKLNYSDGTSETINVLTGDELINFIKDKVKEIISMEVLEPELEII